MKRKTFAEMMDEFGTVDYNNDIQFVKKVTTVDAEEIAAYLVKIGTGVYELPLNKKWAQNVLQADCYRAAKWLIKKYSPLPEASVLGLTAFN